jgi:phosphoglycerol transferase MdoB-like AlkP superfamily enzyme
MDGRAGERAGTGLGPSVRSPSLWRTLVFWWLLLVVIQQAQRLDLLIGAVAHETPSAHVLLMTVVTGIRADLVTAGFGIAVALLIAVVGGALVIVRRRRPADMSRAAARILGPVAATIAGLYVLLLTADFGYYQYSGHRMDAVFFEYIGDVIAQLETGSVASSQVGRQTAAEAGAIIKWIGPIVGYVVIEAGAVMAWWWLFTRFVSPAFAAWEGTKPRLLGFALLLAVAVGASGMHPAGPDSVQKAAISHSTYYMLAQSSLWYVGVAVDQTIWMPAAAPASVLAAMPEVRAYRIAQAILLPDSTFPSSRYPLVHAEQARGAGLARQPNVLLLFVEALDRRYLGRTYDGVRGTPFLDRLRGDSVYFENFLTNGTRTLHGLFSSLCSSLPRGGSVGAIKARYANDYMCLPTLLRRAGYQTRMVIGQNRDVSHSRLGLFMARNGLDALIDDSGFPAGTERMGLGITDGALFARLRAEIADLRARRRPYFLTTLTTGTHHPFAVPDVHPDVAALRAQPDPYVAALRCLDFELERFFTGLQRDGLLGDTLVLVLGDHGRHEQVDRAAAEHQSGHFMSPLAMWLDPSLRTPASYRPRVVSSLVSQVDLTPTVLGLAGLTPQLSPFVGRDVSCALSADCVADRLVYLSSRHAGNAGVADRDGFWFYSSTEGTVEHSDLAQRRPPERLLPGDPAVAERVDRILALYVTANALIEQNRLWSWKEFGNGL